MRKYSVLFTIAFALSFAQGLSAQHLTKTDVPRILSYQGHITNADQAVTGVHPITVRLYSDPEGKHKLWEDTYTTDVKDGIFSVLLGSRTALPTTERLDKPIWLGVSVSGTDELRPLTQFTTAPYALNVPDKSITKEKLSEELQTLMTKSIGGQEKQETDDWDLAGNAPGSSDKLGTTNTVPLKVVSQNKQAVIYHGGVNNITGGWNSTITSGYANVISGGGGLSDHGVGSSNANEIYYAQYATIGGGAQNKIRTGIGDTTTNEWAQTIAGGAKNEAQRYYSTVGGGHCNWSIGKYTTIGGGFHNTASDNAEASTIGGGDSNVITQQRSYIGGGEENIIRGAYNAISGGYKNLIDTNTEYSVVTGGYKNTIFPNGDSSFIGGGRDNGIRSFFGTIGGGDTNQILTDADYSSIGGGNYHSISSIFGTIPGGCLNVINTTSAFSTIGGGTHSTIYDDAESSVIAGGNSNNIWTGSDGSVISGGIANNISVNAISSVIAGGLGNAISKNSWRNAISGGYFNLIDSNATYSNIGGGQTNYIFDDYNVVGGGSKNRIYGGHYSVISGGEINAIRSNYGTIGGGDTNVIRQYSELATIGGGLFNLIDTVAPYSFIGGGQRNRVWRSSTGTIAGGDSNFILDNSHFSFIGGGEQNSIHTLGSHNTISGGHCNWMFHDNIPMTHSTIGGGLQNRIRSSSFGTIGGGSINTIIDGSNMATIAGGDSNVIKKQWGSVGGGRLNFIQDNGEFATITGGRHNIAVGYGQTVTGVFNRNVTAGFSADSTFLDNTHRNQPLFIVGNGTSSLNRTNAFEVSNNGHSTVFDVNGEAVFNSGIVDPAGRPYIVGSTYQDNVIYAWGDVTGSATVPLINVNGSFGVKQVIRNGLGDYTIVLTGTDPSTGNPANLTKASITANVVQKYNVETAVCSFIFPSELITDLQGDNKFRIRVKYKDCTEIDARFMFKVVGRQ